MRREQEEHEYVPLTDSCPPPPAPEAPLLALPVDPALFRPLPFGDGIGFSDETLRRVAKRAAFEDPLGARSCRRCGAAVLLLKRHCSLCGLVCCRSCTGRWADLAHLGFDRPARVCPSCAARLQKDPLFSFT